MSYYYLNNKNWSEITRDERTFCMYLFSAFRDNPDKLIQLIEQTESPYKGFINNLQTTGKKWELGFEVCFYRDLLYENGIRIKKDAKQIEEKTHIKDANKLIKRTFDLCLFSEDEIILIEAKSNESYTSAQFADFENDRFHIQEIFKFLNIANPPKVYFVALASSKYFKSSSFTKVKGVAKKYLLKKKVANSLISWEQIANYKSLLNSLEKRILTRADTIYNH